MTPKWFTVGRITETGAFEWNPYDTQISLKARTVSSRMRSQAGSFHCEYNKKPIWSHASYVGKHTGSARDACSIFFQAPRCPNNSNYTKRHFLDFMKIKSSLVWNKKEMAKPCRHRRPWGQNMCTILTNNRDQIVVLKSFCFSAFFVTGKESFSCVVWFEICDRVIFWSGIKQREMKEK